MDKKVVNVPYFVAEGMADRLSKANRRLWTICILLIVLLVGTNAMWLWYESQFVYEVQEVTQDAEDGANYYVGGDLNGTTNN